MKAIFVLGLCVVAVMGLNVPSSLREVKDIREKILSEEDKMRLAPAIEDIEERNEDGEFTMHYKTIDGTEVYEKGWFVPNANGTKVLVVEGFYSYLDGKDGKRLTTTYRTDVSGVLEVEGEHLPKAPEPEA